MGKATEPKGLAGLPKLMKIVKRIAILMICLQSLSPQTYANFDPAFLSFELTAQLISSPEQISEVLRQDFRVVEDQDSFGHDYWQSPEEFWENKIGDCEDFAYLANYLLKLLGRKSYVISIYGDNYAHTVTVFKQHKTFYVFSMGKLTGYDSKNLKELLTDIHSSWKWAAVARMENHQGKLVQKISR